MTVHYTIHHFVTTDDSSEPPTSTVHGNDDLCIWTTGDPETDDPDERLEMPTDGWAWRSDSGGWLEHPDALSEYATDPTDVVRVDPWDTALTDGY